MNLYLFQKLDGAGGSGISRQNSKGLSIGGCGMNGEGRGTGGGAGGCVYVTGAGSYSFSSGMGGYGTSYSRWG